MGLRLRLALSVLCVGGLTACTPDLGAGVFSSKRAASRITVTSANVTVAGPEGYCVDPEATSDGGSSAFVLLASCASVTGDARRPAPEHPALLMATVSPLAAGEPAVSTSLDRLEAYFLSEAGQAALSRAGRAETVDILETARVGDMFLIHAADSSENRLAGVQRDYWRALFDVEGAIVAVSVVGFAARPLSTAQGRAALLDFGGVVRANNTPPAVTAPPARAVPPPAVAPPPPRPGRNLVTRRSGLQS